MKTYLFLRKLKLGKNDKKNQETEIRELKIQVKLNIII